VPAPVVQSPHAKLPEGRPATKQTQTKQTARVRRLSVSERASERASACVSVRVCTRAIVPQCSVGTGLQSTVATTDAVVVRIRRTVLQRHFDLSIPSARPDSLGD
jgi:hypothetical protein